MQLLGVIPARMAATRFPGKPLVALGRRPVIQWVWEGASAAGVFDDVVVATPDQEIADAVRAFGGAAVLTGDHHVTGTDRVAEVAGARPEADVVVNVQGDQPFVTGRMLRSLVEPYRSGARPSMTTLGTPLDLEVGLRDPNTVKVVCDRNGDALYFSRSAIPYFRSAGPAPVFHHVGLYAFTREFLLEYAMMEETELERCEGLEQLRAMEHGHRIRVCRTDETVIEVNTPEDLAAAEARLSERGAPS